MRDLPVGNGSLLVNFDEKYQLRDFYFPHVGQENHTEGFPFRFGIWVDGEFSWVFSDDWNRDLRYLPDTLVTSVTIRNEKLGIELFCNDTVVKSEDLFLRSIRVTDLFEKTRKVRVFLHHDFRIYENKVGDTAFYDPDTLALIHYQKHRYFLINSLPHFDEFATGRKAFHNSEGTWRDAEDGDLHGGTITEGSVDSTIGVFSELAPGGSSQFDYWIAAGISHHEVARLNRVVLDRGPGALMAETRDHWTRWLGDPKPEFEGLSAQVDDLYRRSLLIIRTQIDNGGAIIAANDHDVTERATDHYSYLWPRDGAFVANALDIAGFPQYSRAFFELSSRIVHERGYFLQKYNPDGSVGSGWHSYWDKYGKKPMFPIQEDETALVLWAIWEHHLKYGDLELLKEVYPRLIVKCADFMVDFRNPDTGLPRSSWNLWEDRRGVHTFTCATVVAGLRAGAQIAHLFEDQERAEKYSVAADEMVSAMRTHLYSESEDRFLRGLLANGDDSLTPDSTVDASLFGIFYFGCFDVDDPMVKKTMQTVEQRLMNHGPYGGVMRFENDNYMRSGENSPNSWIITTLWLAEYYIASAKTVDDLAKALAILEWTANRALPSGVLAEQIDPETGNAMSVSPLTWSHSTFVAAVHSYTEKLKQF
jgi:oligosaccharide amylase